MENLSITNITVLNMGPDTNYFNVRDNRTGAIYTLGRTAAMHYEHIRTGQILKALVSSKGNVISVMYPELDQLAEVLVNK